MPIQVTRETLRGMAALAGFPIDEERLAALTGELEWLIATLRALDEVDTEGFEPVTIAVIEG